ncbi:glycoside hydrolase family 38 C-terminal domain-containing protein [Hungatella sp.]|jgi:alpha-mannosidase|uniref:alpha-mannosidase n=1 Tax=Hungatella sp. TaxID=2613924 RepID=UPI002A7F0445|nr:glycoside hydrolase family 38 C-terminal domain-containing protein [Hungatella sp.]
MEKDKKLYMIGNAHIDVVWLWRWQEGLQEVKATFKSVLDRMKEYDDFIFTGSSAAYYEWVEENDPAMFEEICMRVKEGRWVIVGGWWTEPDCNAPCGESFVRQGLYGQRYFEEKFGVKSVCGYNVDSFGHNGNLPQILKKCGMDSYVFMRPGRHEKGIAGETFVWKSADGSSVHAFRLPFEYCTWPDQIEEHVRRCAGEIKNSGGGIMCFYGVGNHGGGPTKRNIDSIHQMDARPDLPVLKLSSPNEYFEDVKKSGRDLPVVCGGLFHHSSGCYSAESRVKALNREAEMRLLMAERVSVMAGLLAGGKYPAEEYRKAWKSVLFNQFHDILAGTSLRESYEDAAEDYGYALHIAGRGLNSAVQSLSWQINIPMEEGMKPLVVVNPNAFEAKAEVQAESWTFQEGTVLLDEQGNQIPYQLVQSSASLQGRCRICFVADLPSLGWRTYRFAVREKAETFPEVTASECSAENKWFKLTLDPESGYITSLLKKNDGTEYFSGPAAVPVVIRDESDTWSHAVRIFDDEIGRFKAISVRLIESGPVKCVFRVTSVYGVSRMIQDFSVFQDLDYITVKTTVDWREKLAMLKLQFPMNMNYLRTSWEIPYGVEQREPDGEEYPMQMWMDLEGTNPGMETSMNGLSILNDGKFAGSVAGKTAALTVLRSPVYTHHEPYQLQENLEYVYVDQGTQTFTYSLYPHDGSWENAATVRRAKMMNCQPTALFETYHEGSLKQTGSLLEVNQENIVVEVLKKAEDGSGDVILRAYETAGRSVKAELTIDVLRQTIEADFQPFEIKTLRLPEVPGKKGGVAVWTNMLEE